MSELQKAQMIGALTAFLEQKGFEVSHVDVADVPSLAASIGKPYLTPLISPTHNDFSSATAHWLALKSGESVAAMTGARLEDLGDQNLGQYLMHSLSRAYPTDFGGCSISDLRSDRLGEINGRVVYIGDLFFAPNFRRQDGVLRAYLAVLHLVNSLKWNAGHSYCFLTERDAERGAGLRYGMPNLIAKPFDWVDPPEGRGNDEWLAVLPKGEVMAVCGAVLRRVGCHDRSAKIQNAPIPLRVTNAK